MRHARFGDVSPVMGALIRMLDKSPAPQMQYAHPAAAEASICWAIKERRAYIVHGYFVMVDVGSDWYTFNKYLIEQIIIKVYDTHLPVTAAIECLDAIAREHGCEAIAVGDTQVGYMTPLYQAAGYKTIGTQLIKECNTHGVHP